MIPSFPSWFCFAVTGIPGADSATVSSWVLGFLGVLTIVVLLLNAVVLIQKVFGRKPPIEVDLHAKADKDSLNKLEVNLQGFARTEELKRLEQETERRAKGIEAQVSEIRHEVRQEMQGLKSTIQANEEENSASFRDLNTQMRGNGERLAAVQKQSDLILAALNNLETKVDRNNERRAHG